MGLRKQRMHLMVRIIPPTRTTRNICMVTRQTTTSRRSNLQLRKPMPKQLHRRLLSISLQLKLPSKRLQCRQQHNTLHIIKRRHLRKEQHRNMVLRHLRRSSQHLRRSKHLDRLQLRISSQPLRHRRRRNLRNKRHLCMHNLRIMLNKRQQPKLRLRRNSLRSIRILQRLLSRTRRKHLRQ